MQLLFIQLLNAGLWEVMLFGCGPGEVQMSLASFWAFPSTHTHPLALAGKDGVVKSLLPIYLLLPTHSLTQHLGRSGAVPCAQLTMLISFRRKTHLLSSGPNFYISMQSIFSTLSLVSHVHWYTQYKHYRHSLNFVTGTSDLGHNHFWAHSCLVMTKSHSFLGGIQS